MPKLDGTGPFGMGPMTGCGCGRCSHVGACSCCGCHCFGHKMPTKEEMKKILEEKKKAIEKEIADLDA